jgi:hypothetical protein
MTGPAECEVIGRWRIVSSDVWDRDYLDLVQPAFIHIGQDGRGELAFGAVNASLDFDEGDAVNGSGSVELLEDGSLEVEISFHLGDDAVLRAERDPSSTPC